MSCEKENSFPGLLPSPPKPKSTPLPVQHIPPKSERRKRTLLELRGDENLSVAFKKKKIRETAVNVMKEASTLCKSNGESLGSVLGECCCLNGNAGREAREVVMTTFDSLIKEKGVQAAFSKLLPEGAWDERVKALRVPDWHYLLFKSRISDSAWQDLINLTKLGRTGVKSTNM